jgi:hypothetical protein
LYEVLKYAALYRGVRNEWRRSRRQKARTMADYNAILKEAYISPIQEALNYRSPVLLMLDPAWTDPDPG